MATATIAPTSATTDIKTVIVKVRNEASQKLEFLLVLAKKASAATSNGVTQGYALLRRVWNMVPAEVSGTVASALTSTRSGYTSVTGVIRTGIGFVTGLFTKALVALDIVIDWTGGNIAWVVGKVNKDFGHTLRNANADFSDTRRKFAEYAYVRLASLGYVIKNAYNHNITVRITTAFSVAVSTGMTANLITGGKVAKTIATTPYVGAFLAASLSGGFATIGAIAAVASLGATIALVVKPRAIVAEAVATAEAAPVEVTTEIVAMSNGEVSVAVTGDITAEVAQKAAEEHVKAEAIRAAQAVRKDYPRPNGQQNRNRSKNGKRR